MDQRDVQFEFFNTNFFQAANAVTKQERLRWPFTRKTFILEFLWRRANTVLRNSMALVWLSRNLFIATLLLGLVGFSRVESSEKSRHETGDWSPEKVHLLDTRPVWAMDLMGKRRRGCGTVRHLGDCLSCPRFARRACFLPALETCLYLKYCRFPLLRLAPRAPSLPDRRKALFYWIPWFPWMYVAGSLDLLFEEPNATWR